MYKNFFNASQHKFSEELLTLRLIPGSGGLYAGSGVVQEGVQALTRAGKLLLIQITYIFIIVLLLSKHSHFFIAICCQCQKCYHF